MTALLSMLMNALAQVGGNMILHQPIAVREVHLKILTVTCISRLDRVFFNYLYSPSFPSRYIESSSYSTGIIEYVNQSTWASKIQSVSSETLAKFNIGFEKVFESGKLDLTAGCQSDLGKNQPSQDCSCKPQS